MWTYNVYITNTRICIIYIHTHAHMLHGYIGTPSFCHGSNLWRHWSQSCLSRPNFFSRARMEIGTVAWWELLIWFLRWEMFGAPSDLRFASVDGEQADLSLRYDNFHGEDDDQLMDFAGAARGISAWQSLKPYLIFNLSHRDRSWWNWCKAINPIEFDTLKSALRFTLSFLLSRFLHKLLMLREFLDHFQAHEWRPTYVEITWKSSTSCSGDFLNVKRGKPPIKVGRASVKVQGPGGRWRSHCSRL